MNGGDLKRALVEVVAAIPRPTVAIFLSGGYDSWSLVCAARAAGKEVTGYVFGLSTLGRPSTDVKYARLNAKEMGVKLVEIWMGPTDADLVRDIVAMKRTLGVKTKAEIECVWPFYRSVKSVAQQDVLLGHEDLYCLTKRAALHFRTNLDAYRAEAREHAANQNRALDELFRSNNITLTLPYEQETVRALFAGHNWDDLHKPGVKQPTVDAFPDEFARLKLIRQGLQVGDSGIRDRFFALLESPYNVIGAKNPVALYNRL